MGKYFIVFRVIIQYVQILWKKIVLYVKEIYVFINKL